MRIEDIRVHLLVLPWREQPAVQRGYSRDRNVLAVEIETRSGHVGLGYQLYLREGFRTVKTCLEETMVPHLIGRDASEIEAIWRELWTARWRTGGAGRRCWRFRPSTWRSGT